MPGFNSLVIILDLLIGQANRNMAFRLKPNWLLDVSLYLLNNTSIIILSWISKPTVAEYTKGY